MLPPKPWVFDYEDDPATGRELRWGHQVMRPLVKIEVSGPLGTQNLYAWRAQWPAVLGQRGFFDHYTVIMSRFSQAVAVYDMEQFDQ